MNKIADKISRFARQLIIIFTLVFAVFLTIVSIFQTVDMNTNNSWLENVVFQYGSPASYFITIPYVLGIALILYKFRKSERAERFLWFSPFALAGFIFISGIAWVYSAQSAPTHDSWIVMNAAVTLANGDFSSIQPEHHYFHFYPYQLGYVLFSEIFIRLFSWLGYDYAAGNLLNLQVVNVFCLAVAYYVTVQITKITFKNKMITLYTTILLFLCLQPILFSTFLYGNAPGFMFTVLSVWLALLFFQKFRIWQGILSAICLGMAVAVKYNNMIVLVALCAMILLNLLKALKKSNFKATGLCAGFLAVSLTCGLGLPAIAVWQYEARSGIKMDSGIPMTAWAAMGLSEAYVAPGWHNATFLGAYNERDTAKAIEANMEVIKERLETFAENPYYTIAFFFRKFTSQWNEATYQSIWTNQVRGQYAEKTGIAAYICNSYGEEPLKAYMSIYNSVIFTMFSLGLLFALRKKKINAVFLPLIVLGGFMFHLIFEAKSQYAIFYFVMMIPMAGYGLYMSVKWVDSKIGRKKNDENEYEKIAVDVVDSRDDGDGSSDVVCE
jgi:hypothetical protein